MRSNIKIDFENNTLIMSKSFAEKARCFGTQEYQQLQNARRDYTTFAVATRQIKRNPHKESYKGLTYDYMREYICNHETGEAMLAKLRKLAQLIEISKCHSRRYPVIKNWFLAQYPEVKQYGMPHLDTTQMQEEVEEAVLEEVA